MTKRTHARWLLPTVLSVCCAAAWPAGDATTRPSTEGQAADAQGGASANDARRMRASTLIGMEVRNRQGEKLGEITDMMLDLKNQRVRYAVVSHGGLAGLGNKLFAYPIQAFDASRDRDELVLNVPRERLEDAPGFAEDQWPPGDDPRYWRDVDRHFGAAGRAATEGSGRAPGMVRASDLIDKDIDDRSGNGVGEVEDVIVSPGDGRLRYLVVEVDRGIDDDKLRAVPATALTMHADRDAVLNVAPDELKAQPGFDEGRWPDLNDPAYRRQVEERLGTTAARQLNEPYRANRER